MCSADVDSDARDADAPGLAAVGAEVCIIPVD